MSYPGVEGLTVPKGEMQDKRARGRGEIYRYQKKEMEIRKEKKKNEGFFLFYFIFYNFVTNTIPAYLLLSKMEF